MPTFREDLHLGHEVPMVGTDDLVNRCVTEEKIDDNAVSLRKIAQDVIDYITNAITGAITAYKKVVDAAFEHLHEAMNDVNKRMNDLQQQINSQQEHGVAVSDEFGDNDHISVSQKALTQAFNRLWSVLDDFTGEVHQGINMLVSPDYFIGEDACDIHITASTVGLNGPFEHIELLVNGIKIAEADDVDYYEFDTQITESSVIMCKAKIMGITYEQQKVVTHHNSFWLGAGTNYAQVMDVEHVIPITNGMRGAYNVSCNTGDHLFVIVADTLRAGFIRADMNGAEIAFTESTVTIDGKQYNVLTSENTFQAATYNIDING